MDNRLNKLLLTLILMVSLIIGSVPSLLAEETSEVEFTLEEIIVTAQKREENQQNVPIAMEVISGEELAAMGSNNVDEILDDVANVLINTSVDGMRVSLRGLSNTDGLSNSLNVSEPTVAINMDGVYNNSNTAGQNLYDIERVEVLFGPQSTMYGSNSPGGIVNIVTASPKTDRYSASASVEYASFGSASLQTALNAPVFRDKIALRLSGSASKQGSWSSEGEASRNKSARLRALWNTTDDLSFTLTGSWSKASQGGFMGGTVVPFIDQDDVDDPWTLQESDNTKGANQNDQITKSGSADVSWDTKFGALSFTPSYSKSSSEGKETTAAGGGPGGGGGEPPPMSFTGSGISISGITAMQEEGEESESTTNYGTSSNIQKGAELRMTSPRDFTWFTWIVGGTWNKSTQKRTVDYVDEDTVDTESENTNSSKGLYANITYPLWFYTKFKLTLGYRQSWSEAGNETTENAGPGGEAGTTTTNQEYNKPDFKYGFQWDAADNLMIYGNYSSSYRAQSMQMDSNAGAEELDSYTAGAKSTLFDRKLQLNVSTFFYDYQNKMANQRKYQNNVVEAEYNYDFNNDGDTEDTVNVSDNQSQGYGDFRSIGVDLQANWIITSRDKVNFSVSYLNSEWTDLYFDYEYDILFEPESYDGVSNTNSPTWSMTASYSHNFILGSFGSLRPQIDMQHKTSYRLIWNPNDENAAYGHQEAYYLWNGSASFSHSSGRWSLNASVKNITNYAVKASYMDFGGSYSMMINDPRTYSAVLSVNF